MARKDVTDKMVVEAYIFCREHGDSALGYLMISTGEPLKVCWRAMERTLSRNYIDFGTSLRTAWVTNEGYAYLARMNKEQEDAVSGRT